MKVDVVIGDRVWVVSLGALRRRPRSIPTGSKTRMRLGRWVWHWIWHINFFRERRRTSTLPPTFSLESLLLCPSTPPDPYLNLDSLSLTLPLAEILQQIWPPGGNIWRQGAIAGVNIKQRLSIRTTSSCTCTETTSQIVSTTLRCAKWLQTCLHYVMYTFPL